MGCSSVMTAWTFSRLTRSWWKRCPYPRNRKWAKQPKYAANWCVAATTSLRPTRYAISSLTAKESWEWITVRCSCPMTCTRWRKKHSVSTTHRHRPTSRRLTSISSTASGRCSKFRSRSTMIVIRKNKYSIRISKSNHKTYRLNFKVRIYYHYS